MTRLTDAQRADRELSGGDLQKQVTEAQFLSQVVDLARLYQFRVAHFRPAWTGRGWRTPVQGDGKGFPDALIVGRGRVIAAELKASRGRATPDQLAWLQAFSEAGVESYLWRPEDFDEIVRVLANAPR